MKERAVGILVLFMMGFTFIAAITVLFTMNRHGYFADGEWVYGWSAVWRGFPLYLFVGLVFGCISSIFFFYSFEEAYRRDGIRQQAQLDIANESVQYRMDKEREEMSKEYQALYAAQRKHETSVQMVKQRELNSGAEARRAADKLARGERKLKEAKQLVAENKAKMNRLSGQINRQREKIAKLDSE